MTVSSAVQQASVELEAVLARFHALSEVAARACAAGDDAALAGALDARDLLLARLGTLAAVLGTARRQAATPRARQAIDQRLHPLRAAVAAALTANTTLERDAQGVRTALGDQLDRLRHDDAARSAYTAIAGPTDGHRLDRTQ